MKTKLTSEDAYRMLIEGKRNCDIAKEFGVSISWVGHQVRKGKRQKDAKERGPNLSTRACNALYSVGALGSDEKILEAYKTGWLSVGGESPTPNYGRKTEMEIREYLFVRGLLPKEKPNPHRKVGLADIIAQALNTPVLE